MRDFAAKIIIRNLYKEFPGKGYVLKNINLEVKDGEFLVLLGPSGCGKSTLLRTIAGLERVTSGEIIIEGKVVNDVPAKDRNVAMVFQSYALYPHMTVYENMAFALKLKGLSKSEIDRRVREAARLLGIEHHLKSKPRELSGGERQRVAVGRAIVRKPKVFLFDEPLSNLDARLRTQMRAEFKKLHTALGITTIYVTHDQVEAMTLGDRIVVLRNGEIQQIGTPMEVYTKPQRKFVAEFLGSPSMNFMEGKIQDGLFISEGIKIPVGNNKLPEKEVYLGIRPEHIEIEENSSLKAKLIFKEVLGEEFIFHVSLGASSFKIKSLRDFPGEEIPMVFPEDKIYLFAKDTEELIYPK